MSELSHTIRANDRTITEVLDNKKYTVDYFQREYKWEEKHIEELVFDLTSAFLNEYKPENKRELVELYNSYYLGPFVVSEKGGQRSIIDGQQRLTSLTLLLIYLNNLQKELDFSESLETYIFSEKFGKKSFNIQVDERESCLNELYSNGYYTIKDDDDESTINMAERYHDIEKSFPEELKNGVFPYFLDWLKYRVILVEIVAFTDENAYTIFETMNDRGLNLTPTEMLKGFILSKFSDRKKRQQANEFWQKSMQKLHEFDKNEDQKFFQAWLRGKYAETIRPGKAGSKNEDFEKIGTRFHSWFRDNLDKINLSQEESDKFESFLEVDFKFFYKAYLRIINSEQNFDAKLEHIYYIRRWGIANSLSYPMLLASLNVNDSEEQVIAKLDLVARYIETFVIRRSVNFRKFASSSIRYTMYTLVKEIRNKSIPELKSILNDKLNEMEENIDGLKEFRMHGQNRAFVKYLLSRLTSFIEINTGLNSSFDKFYYNYNGKPFEVEHIWGDKFEEHKDEFDQETDFQQYRNRLGGLVLLPRGTNQSYGAKPYKDKLEHYIKENLLVQSLSPITYKNNPNFLSMMDSLSLPFKAHEHFLKQDIIDRQELYWAICNIIWSSKAFKNEN